MINLSEGQHKAQHTGVNTGLFETYWASDQKRACEMARMDISMEKVGLAAQTGAPDALFELGMLYATGRDVAPDLVVAHKWFNLAAVRGNSSALTHRMELAREMSALQIAEAQKLAREWIATH
jgi:TPR repeat protein